VAGSRGQGTEGPGDRGDDGEQDEGGEEAQDQGKGESDGGLAGCGLGLQPGAGAEGFGSGGERLRRWGSPAFGRLKGGGRRAELVEPGAVGGFSEGSCRGPAEAQDGCRQTEVLVEDVRSPLGDPEYGLVRVEAGPQGRAEQVEDSRRRRAPCSEPSVDRASSTSPHRNWPSDHGKQGDHGQAWRPRHRDAEQEPGADPDGQPTKVSPSRQSLAARVDIPPRS
jgi:hypothetical protein